MNTLIVTGGEIDLEFLKSYQKQEKFDMVIAVDKGLEALYSLNIMPNHIVGDFDSVKPEILSFYKNNSSIVFHKYIPEKDATDTQIALELAIKLNSSSITIIGAFGKRIDHLLANIHILTYALNSNIPCYLLDKNNKVYLIHNDITLYKEKTFGKYISLVPLTSNVEGLSLKGFKYPLSNYTLSVGTSLGVSNEINNDIATIQLSKGTLVVVESCD